MSSAQVLNYTPNRKLDKTVAVHYYNTEFIFITNISGQSLSLNFDLIDNTLLPEWSSTICTNQTCYSSLPKNGSMGALTPGEDVYISFNMAANEAIGSGQVRYLISSSADTALHDTVTFKYTVTEDGTVKAGPWANVNYAHGVLTILLDNPNLEANLSIYTLDGRTVYEAELNPITSVPLRDYGPATYLIYIRDEYNRVIKKKLVHSTP